MSIGYSVEGATDRAFLEGLRRRWCPDAVLIEGAFIGRSDTSLRRDIPRICQELGHKGAEVIVFLTDANDQDWRRVKQRESRYVPVEFHHRMLYGVPERNIECWLTVDREYAAKHLNVPPKALDVPDPKGVFERALGITSYDRKEEEIASFVRDAPIRNWLESRSFETFYEDARVLGKQQGHPIPNEWERA